MQKLKEHHDEAPSLTLSKASFKHIPPLDEHHPGDASLSRPYKAGVLMQTCIEN